MAFLLDALSTLACHENICMVETLLTAEPLISEAVTVNAICNRKTLLVKR